MKVVKQCFVGHSAEVKIDHDACLDPSQEEGFYSNLSFHTSWGKTMIRYALVMLIMQFNNSFQFSPSQQIKRFGTLLLKLTDVSMLTNLVLKRKDIQLIINYH